MDFTEEKFPDLSGSDALTLAKSAVRALYKKLALGIKLIYAADTTVLTDYYIVAYGRSATHCRALANELERVMSASSVFCKHPEGLDAGEWILLDLGNVIVHVFSREAGEFYRFERLFREEDFVSIDDIISDTEADANEQ